MKYLILFALFLNSFTYSPNTKMEVSYKIIVLNSNFDNTDPVIKSEILNIYRQAENLEFVLKILDDKTHFKMREDMISDKNEYFEKAIVHVGGKYEYFQNSELKLKHGDIFGEEMSILLDKEKYSNWNILKEKKMILGYPCFKAESEYKSFDKNGNEIEIEVFAWFTPQIPISGGPLDFGGLPGLILEAGKKDQRIIFTARNIEFNPDFSVVEKPKTKKTITSEEYDIIVKKVLKMIRDRG